MKIASLSECLPGDIILSRSGTWLSKAIRWVQTRQTGSAEYSHASVSIGDGLIIEALWRITIGEIKKYQDQAIEVWRLPLSDEERRSFERGMMQMAGGDYGLGKLFLFAADAAATQVSRIFGRKDPVWWFTDNFGFTNIPVCSELVAFGIEKFTKFNFLDFSGFDVPWKRVTPDYLQDLLKLPINKAEVVFKQVTN
jgi:hypothetical protein